MRELVWYPSVEEPTLYRAGQVVNNVDGALWVRTTDGKIIQGLQRETMFPKHEEEETGDLVRHLLNTYSRGLVYSVSTGNAYGNTTENAIIAMNPLREMPIFSDHFIQRYASLDVSLPPHIFQTAALTYRDIISELNRSDEEASRDFSIYFCGVPNSGKSKSFKHSLDFFTHAAAMDSESAQKLSSIIPALSPFFDIRYSGSSSPSKSEHANPKSAEPSSEPGFASGRGTWNLSLLFDTEGFIVQGITNFVYVDVYQLHAVLTNVMFVEEGVENAGRSSIVVNTNADSTDSNATSFEVLFLFFAFLLTKEEQATVLRSRGGAAFLKRLRLTKGEGLAYYRDIQANKSAVASPANAKLQDLEIKTAERARDFRRALTLFGLYENVKTKVVSMLCSLAELDAKVQEWIGISTKIKLKRRTMLALKNSKKMEDRDTRQTLLRLIDEETRSMSLLQSDAMARSSEIETSYSTMVELIFKTINKRLLFGSDLSLNEGLDTFLSEELQTVSKTCSGGNKEKGKRNQAANRRRTRLHLLQMPTFSGMDLEDTQEGFKKVVRTDGGVSPIKAGSKGCLRSFGDFLSGLVCFWDYRQNFPNLQTTDLWHLCSSLYQSDSFVEWQTRSEHAFRADEGLEIEAQHRQVGGNSIEAVHFSQNDAMHGGKRTLHVLSPWGIVSYHVSEYWFSDSAKARLESLQSILEKMESYPDSVRRVVYCLRPVGFVQSSSPQIFDTMHVQRQLDFLVLSHPPDLFIWNTKYFILKFGGKLKKYFLKALEKEGQDTADKLQSQNIFLDSLVHFGQTVLDSQWHINDFYFYGDEIFYNALLELEDVNDNDDTLIFGMHAAVSGDCEIDVEKYLDPSSSVDIPDSSSPSRSAGSPLEAGDGDIIAPGTIGSTAAKSSVDSMVGGISANVDPNLYYTAKYGDVEMGNEFVPSKSSVTQTSSLRIVSEENTPIKFDTTPVRHAQSYKTPPPNQPSQSRSQQSAEQIEPKSASGRNSGGKRPKLPGLSGSKRTAVMPCHRKLDKEKSLRDRDEAVLSLTADSKAMDELHVANSRPPTNSGWDGNQTSPNHIHGRTGGLDVTMGSSMESFTGEIGSRKQNTRIKRPCVTGNPPSSSSVPLSPAATKTAKNWNRVKNGMLTRRKRAFLEVIRTEIQILKEEEELRREEEALARKEQETHAELLSQKEEDFQSPETIFWSTEKPLCFSELKGPPGSPATTLGVLTDPKKLPKMCSLENTPQTEFLNKEVLEAGSSPLDNELLRGNMVLSPRSRGPTQYVQSYMTVEPLTNFSYSELMNTMEIHEPIQKPTMRLKDVLMARNQQAAQKDRAVSSSYPLADHAAGDHSAVPGSSSDRTQYGTDVPTICGTTVGSTTSMKTNCLLDPNSNEQLLESTGTVEHDFLPVKRIPTPEDHIPSIRPTPTPENPPCEDLHEGGLVTVEDLHSLNSASANIAAARNEFSTNEFPSNEEQPVFWSTRLEDIAEEEEEASGSPYSVKLQEGLEDYEKENVLNFSKNPRKDAQASHDSPESKSLTVTAEEGPAQDSPDTEWFNIEPVRNDAAKGSTTRGYSLQSQSMVQGDATMQDQSMNPDRFMTQDNSIRFEEIIDFKETYAEEGEIPEEIEEFESDFEDESSPDMVSQRVGVSDIGVTQQPQNSPPNQGYFGDITSAVPTPVGKSVSLPASLPPAPDAVKHTKSADSHDEKVLAGKTRVCQYSRAHPGILEDEIETPAKGKSDSQNETTPRSDFLSHIPSPSRKRLEQVISEKSRSRRLDDPIHNGDSIGVVLTDSAHESSVNSGQRLASRCDSHVVRLRTSSEPLVTLENGNTSILIAQEHIGKDVSIKMQEAASVIRPPIFNLEDALVESNSTQLMDLHVPLSSSRSFERSSTSSKPGSSMPKTSPVETLQETLMGSESLVEKEHETRDCSTKFRTDFPAKDLTDCAVKDLTDSSTRDLGSDLQCTQSYKASPGESSLLDSSSTLIPISTTDIRDMRLKDSFKEIQGTTRQGTHQDYTVPDSNMIFTSTRCAPAQDENAVQLAEAEQDPLESEDNLSSSADVYPRKSDFKEKPSQKASSIRAGHITYSESTDSNEEIVEEAVLDIERSAASIDDGTKLNNSFNSISTVTRESVGKIVKLISNNSSRKPSARGKQIVGVEELARRESSAIVIQSHVRRFLYRKFCARESDRTHSKISSLASQLRHKREQIDITDARVEELQRRIALLKAKKEAIRADNLPVRDASQGRDTTLKAAFKLLQCMRSCILKYKIPLDSEGPEAKSVRQFLKEVELISKNSN